MIRKARKADAEALAAILELAQFGISDTLFGVSEFAQKMEIFKTFVAAKNNRLSYENILLFEREGVIMGAVCAYDGAWSEFLDACMIGRLRKMEIYDEILSECNEDELYIDSVAVLPEFRGQGIFKELMNAVISRAKAEKFHQISLVTHTPEIYYQFGFGEDGRREICGENFVRMVLCL